MKNKSSKSLEAITHTDSFIKNEIKGITLIALIITIIVLLILAGITVAQLSGNNLFDSAKLAREKYKKSQSDEDSIIDKYTNEIGFYSNLSRDGETNNSLESTILYPNGTKENPANITTNQRIVLNNPYSGHRCYLRAEVLVNGYWGDPGWIWYYCNQGGTDDSYGVKATQLVSDTEDKIVVQSGDYQIVAASSRCGAGFDNNANISSAPLRVVVIKLD